MYEIKHAIFYSYFVILIFIHFAYSTSFLTVHRTGVEEEFSERDHLLTELKEVCLSSQDRKLLASTKDSECLDKNVVYFWSCCSVHS